MAVAIHQFLLEAFRLRRRAYRKSLNRCRRRVSEGSVHELRVESRRLLATLELFVGIVPLRELDAARRAIRKTLHGLGELRDIQVQLAAIDGLCVRFPELSGLRRRFEKKERRLRKQVAAALSRTRDRSDETMTKVRRALRSQPSAGEHDQADWMDVVSGLAAARDTAQARFAEIEPQAPATIHAARVALKRLRYLVEALRPVESGFTERRIAQLRGPQDRMGRIQDATLLRATVAGYLGKHAASVARTTRILAILDRRKAALVAKFMRQDGDLGRHACFRLSFTWLFARPSHQVRSNRMRTERAMTLRGRNTNVT